LLILLTHIQVAAQRFSVGFNSGFILSQLDGDGFTGYDKMGSRLGIRSQATISGRINLIIELNWEEKGSRFEEDIPSDGRGVKNQVVHLSYAEVPVIFRYYHKSKQTIFVEAGAAISYLTGNRFPAQGMGDSDLPNRYESVSDDFKRSEVNAILGGGYAFTPRFGLIFRTTIGITHLYYNLHALEELAAIPKPQRHSPDAPLVLLRNYLISAGAYYML
jgi:hypothetical protein